MIHFHLGYGGSRLIHKFSFGVCAITVTALLASGCSHDGSGVPSSDNLAVVNNDTITMKDYYSYLERKKSVEVFTPNGTTRSLPVAATLGFQALRDLVQEKVIEQIAADDGVKPTKADVEAEIQFQTTRDPQLVQKALSNGVGIDELRHMYTIDLCKYNIVTKGITVTPAEVDDYIKNNPKEFMNPPTADLLWIYVLSAADKDRVDKELNGGQVFSSVAMRYSQDPQVRQYQGRYQMNVMTPGTASSIPDFVAKLVDASPEHKMTAWVDGHPGFAKFYVEKKTPASEVKITDTIKTLVKRQIAQRRGAQAVDLGARVQEKLKTAKYDIKYKPLKDMWDQATEQLKNTVTATASSATSAGGSGGPSSTGGAPSLKSAAPGK